MKAASIFRICKVAAPTLLSLSLLTPLNAQADAGSLLQVDDPRLTPARVMTLQQEGLTQVVIDGFIHAPTVEAFRSKVSALGGDYGIVYFNSSGGDLSAAEELGRLIRAKGYATQIGKLTSDQKQVGRGVCESACPIAFVGGKFRLLDSNTGQLRVHRFYLARQGRWASDSGVLFTAERELRTYLDEMGVNPEFLEVMMKTPPDQMLTISKRSSYEWKLGTGTDFSSWQLADSGSVQGIGESSTGAMALTFSCKAQKVHVQAKLKPWFPATGLLNYETHSFTVNGRKFELGEVTASYDKPSRSISFDTTLPDDARSAIITAERVGYGLSYEKLPGEYDRSIAVNDASKILITFLARCESE